MIWLALFFAAADPAVVARGDKLFAQNCSIGYCHGAGGAAARGPRLRGRAFDASYLRSAIHDGIPKSAMPAFKERMKQDEIAAVVAYVQSLAGATGEAPATVPVSQPAPLTGSTPVKPGYALFFENNRCGSCHSLGGRGTAVGPDVGKVAKADLAAAINATRSRLVRTVKLKDGETFPALMGKEDGAYVEAFDLTAPPPVKRTLERAEIVSVTPASTWSHQAAAGAYTPEQMADLIAYIRFAAAGE
ncbi:MAG: c-type cytochrome [Bryobacteraceae bacterium]